MKLFLCKLITLCISTIIALVLLETGFHIILNKKLKNPFNPLQKVDDILLRYTLKPNLNFNGFITNNSGFVGKNEFTKHIPKNVKRIIAIGDSLTQGSNQVKPYPFWLQKLLSEESNENWEVINAAVSGYNHNQVYRRIELLVQDGWEFNYIIYGICPNDIFPLTLVTDQFGNIPANYTSNSILKKSILISSLVRILDIALARTNNAPFLYKKRDYFTYCKTVNKYFFEGTYWNDFKTTIIKMLKLSKKNNIKIYFLLFPQALDFTKEFNNDFEKRNLLLLNFFKENNAQVLDTSNSIFNSENIFKLFVPSDPCHPNSEAHKRIAEMIYKRLVPYIHNQQGQRGQF